MAPNKRGSSSASKSPASKSTRSSKRLKVEEVNSESQELVVSEEVEVEPMPGDAPAIEETSSPATDEKKTRKVAKREEGECRFVGDAFPADVARREWPHRYFDKKVRGKANKTDDDEDELVPAKRHFRKAEVDGEEYELYDNAYVQSDGDSPPYICKIVELFEGEDGSDYFTAQWYYRSTDTVIKECFKLKEKKRVFASEIKNDNPLGCLLRKLKILKVKANLDPAAKESIISDCDYYYDLKYLLPYTTFVVPEEETAAVGDDSQSSISSETDDVKAENGVVSHTKGEATRVEVVDRPEMSVLDLYCGCGAMSTGFCLGAKLGSINLVTRWAVDMNKYACESLKLNHPETEVRNESAEDFLMLIKEWEKLCATFSLIDSKNTHENVDAMGADDGDENEEDEEEEDNTDDEVFEVESVLAICYGDPNESDKAGLHFKVRWKGYGPSEDTWEPVDGLGNCRASIGEFVKKGFSAKTLPLPGDVDVVCGGPPCQGISGFNRFRNKEEPLKDPKNRQLLVYMAVVEHLKPRFVLMENVVDLVKFSGGFLGRYAMGRLVDMQYQARMGMMAAGAYGLAQFRMRVFVWGALPTEKLPQYPLPTHDLVLRGVIPTEFEGSVVAYNEGDPVKLKSKLLLGDAISDLPPVGNYDAQDEMPYDGPPKTAFQKFIRLTKDSMASSSSTLLKTLYDHQPLQLNTDDYQRVCRIPKNKGACFRDLPGVRVRADKKVEFDPDMPREYLPSGKPLVPDYAMTFVGGTSSKPFARLWWDVTVPTVVTRAEPHNQQVLHPLQDRVLTIRENARLQGFPDYYQLKGPVKERYMQVGNAVAVPVARALGYAWAMAVQGQATTGPLYVLNPDFPEIKDKASSPCPSIES